MKELHKFNILYLGNWGRGRFCIDTLHKRENINIQAVFTQYSPDSNDSYFNLVHDYALDHNIPTINIYGKNSVEVNSLILDYIDRIGMKDLIGVSVAFEKIFKKNLLSKLKIINLHPSLLPKYRGPAPELWAIKNKEKYIGITLHWVNEGIDTGNILYQDKFEIDYDMSYLEFADWLNAGKSTKVLDDFFEMNTTLNIPGKEQDRLSLYFERIHQDENFYQKKLYEIHDILRKRSF